MNSFSFESDQVLASIKDDLRKMDKSIGEKRPKLLKKIGGAVKKNVVACLNNCRTFEDDNLTNYDGSKPHVHMADDVKVTVSEDGVSVHGGKKTGFKWHIIDSGFLRGSHYIPGKNFVNDAVVISQNQVNQIIDETLSEVANGR